MCPALPKSRLFSAFISLYYVRVSTYLSLCRYRIAEVGRLDAWRAVYTFCFIFERKEKMSEKKGKKGKKKMKRRKKKT